MEWVRDQHPVEIAALEAAERRATVERIAWRFSSELGMTINVHDAEVRVILDEEAAR